MPARRAPPEGTARDVNDRAGHEGGGRVAHDVGGTERKVHPPPAQPYATVARAPLQLDLQHVAQVVE